MGRIAAAHPEGLIIPARPSLGAAQLLLTPKGAVVLRRSARIVLAYERVLDNDQLVSGHSGWRVAPWTLGRYNAAIGLMIGAVGDEAALVRSAPQRIVPRSDRTRLHRAPGEVGVPLLRHQFPRPRADATVGTLAALMWLLRDAPLLRERFTDPRRMRMLADALHRRRLHGVWERTGLDRIGVEVAMAWQATGIVHRYGRPIPGDPVVGPDAVLEAARQALARNRHARHDERADQRLVEHVHAVYLDVQPWPFEALTT